MKWLSDLFEKHRAARRIALFWAIGLITVTVMRFLEMAPSLDGADKVFIAIIGILSVVVGFYQKGRNDDDRSA